MLAEIDVNEIAFAMTLFVSAANGQAPRRAASATQRNAPDDQEGERFFRALAVPAFHTLAPDAGSLQNSGLFRAFRSLWQHYRDDPQRESIVTRVLGFCFLTERTRGAILQGWTAADQDGEDLVVLHSAVVEAIAEVPLDPHHGLTLSAFHACLDRIAQSYPDLNPNGLDEGASVGSAWPAGNSEMARLMRRCDWSSHSLGSAHIWPQSLRTAIDMTLACHFPMIVLWGEHFTQFYNDAYRNIMGVKHPAGMGQPTAHCWPEVWEFNRPVYTRVLAGESLTFEDQLFPILRYGFLENAYFTLCYSPLRDEAAAVAGVLVTVFETTLRARSRDRERHTPADAGGNGRVRSPHGTARLVHWDISESKVLS